MRRHALNALQMDPRWLDNLCKLSRLLPDRDHARVAAVNLANNIGVSGYCGSTAAPRCNAGQNHVGCDAMLAGDTARVGGVLRPVRGLTDRHQRERALCLQDS